MTNFDVILTLMPFLGIFIAFLGIVIIPSFDHLYIKCILSREQCEKVAREVCEPVEREVCQNTKCTKEPICTNVEKLVPREVCSPVERQVCTPKRKKECVQKPTQKCNQVKNLFFILPPNWKVRPNFFQIGKPILNLQLSYKMATLTFSIW